MRRSAAFLGLLLTLASLAIGCGGDDDKEASPSGNGGVQPLPSAPGGAADDPGNPSAPSDQPHQTNGGSWTMLVYVVADNNLEGAAVDDLIEMSKAGRATNARIVVQIDRAEGFSADPIGALGNFTTTKRVEIQNGAFKELSDLGELNMGDPAVLTDFIQWGVKQYPADRVGLVFWDHGAAWPGFGSDDSTGQGDMLNLQELKSGITAGLAGTPLKRFALIGFDACLMGTLEVALALRGSAEYLLASEEVEPGHGWDWATLKPMIQNPAITPTQLASGLIDGFLAQAKVEKTADDVTLSLIDLYQLNAVQAALDGFSATATPLLTSAPDTVTQIGLRREASMRYGEMPDPAQSFNMVDLADMMSRLGDDAQLAAKAKAVADASKGAVLKQMAGKARTGSTGLSIYFPPSAERLKATYDTVEGIEGWRSFLKAYVGAGATAIKPTFTNAGKVADATIADNTLNISGTLDPATTASVVSTTFLYGMRDSGRTFLLGDEPATLSGDTVSATWDFTVLALTQGSTTAFGYLSIDKANGAGAGYQSATVPFGYAATAGATLQYAFRRLVFDSAGATVSDTLYLIGDDGEVGELLPATGATLTPIVQESTDSGLIWVTSGDPFDAGQPIALGYQRLAAGSSGVAFLVASNSTGDGDAVFATGDVP